MFVSGKFTLEAVPEGMLEQLVGVRGILDASECGRMRFKLYDGRVLESQTVRLVRAVAGGSYVYVVTGSGNTYEFVRVS